MDSGATKHMTSHRPALDMYEIIAPHNVHLSDNSVVEAIEMGSIVVEGIVRGNINRICSEDAFHVPKLQPNLLFC